MQSTSVVSTVPVARLAQCLRRALLLAGAGLLCAACDPVPRVASDVPAVTAGAATERVLSDSSGLPGTEQVQQEILDKLGAQPRIEYHVLVDSMHPLPNPLVLRDEAAGGYLTLAPEPAWELRDVASVRLDPQADSTVLVVMLVNVSARTRAYVERARQATVSGALVINDRIFQADAGRLYGNDTDFPATMGPFPPDQAAHLAAQLRAALPKGSDAP